MRIKRLLGVKESSVVSQAAAFCLLALLIAVSGSYVVTAARAQGAAAQAEPKVRALTSEDNVDALARVTAKGAVAEIADRAARSQRVRLMASSVVSSGAPVVAPVVAQAPVSISGVVMDRTGALLPRATVTATNRATHARVSVVTDNTGVYELGPLDAGTYMLTAAAAGFEMQVKNVDLDGTAPVRLNLKLDVGRVSENLDVAGTPADRIHDPAEQNPQVPEARAGRPVRISSGVMQGNLVARPDPVYPAEAKANHVQGAVVLRAVISKTGEIENLTAVSGPAALMVSAIDAVKRWRYKPYLLNGEPTEVETTITVNYTFGGDEGGGRGTGTGSGPVRVAAGVQAGQLVSRVDPVYPAEAKANHVAGAVVLRAIISKTGTVENLMVVSGPKELQGSAIDAVRQWVYKPYLLNGEPTEVDTTITVNFSFGGDGGAGLAGQPAPQGSRGYSAIAATRSQIRARQVELAGLLVNESESNPEVRTLRAQIAELERQERAMESAVSNSPGTPPAGGPKLGEPHRIGGDVSAPKVVSMPNPQYSEEAKAKKIGGSVLVKLVVDQDGMPTHVQVVRGIGYGLDEKAVEAVKRYRFKPGFKDGEPVAVAMNIEVNFQIF